ncbi:Phosphate-repressible phosphate permease pho-4 [Chlorella vulgaris]
MAVYTEYTWIFVCAVFLSIFVAYGIGANDVANAFGSSVGAKALTMKQAILIASVCEFGGAVLLGSGVTDTIRGKIADLDYYVDKPDLYMYGMLCAMMATGIWLILATYLELPVSTTHSITGAVIGMSMIAGGVDSVIWSASKDSFPYLSGVSVIVISWFTSPLLAGIVGAILWLFTRHAVLRRKNSFNLSLMCLPLFTFITVYIGTYYIIQKGPKLADKVSDATNAWISACFAVGGCLIAGFIGIPLLKRQVQRDWDELNKAEVIPELHTADKVTVDAVGKADVESGSDNGVVKEQEELPVGAAGRTPGMFADMRKSKVFGAASKAFTTSANTNIHDVIGTDQNIHNLHANGEQFDRKTELSFKYLQVFTACCNSFAHGSNDVANSIGPFAGIYAVWRCTCVESKSDVPVWILVVGGAGIVLGLATYGYKIMRLLGVKMTKLTNSRGYCVELASAVIIIIGSRYGLPLSTTHCLVGAVTGVGLVEAVSGRRPEGATATNRSAFNWKLLIKFFCGWVATLVVAALTSAAFTAQGVYAPYRIDTDQRVADTTSLNETANSIADSIFTLGASGNTANSALLTEQANIMLTACDSTNVPSPPTTFNYISECVNSMMVALNTTTFSA